jgi:hypothetical protein
MPLPTPAPIATIEPDTILTKTGLPIETLQDKGREKGDFPFEEGRTVLFFLFRFFNADFPEA